MSSPAVCGQIAATNGSSPPPSPSKLASSLRQALLKSQQFNSQLLGDSDSVTVGEENQNQAETESDSQSKSSLDQNLVAPGPELVPLSTSPTKSSKSSQMSISENSEYTEGHLN